MREAIRGSCLCEGIVFSASEPSLGSAHCHCSYCRRAHGAALVTWLLVSEDGFAIEQGHQLLRWFQSSKQSERGFCATCGSSLFFKSTLCPGEVHIARANVLGAVSEVPGYHCFVDEQVDWLATDDGLPRLASDSPELARYRDIKAL